MQCSSLRTIHDYIRTCTVYSTIVHDTRISISVIPAVGCLYRDYDESRVITFTDVRTIKIKVILTRNTIELPRRYLENLDIVWKRIDLIVITRVTENSK